MGIRIRSIETCCSVLQCVAVCCSAEALQVDGHTHSSYRDVLQCVAVCCSVLQCVAVEALQVDGHTHSRNQTTETMQTIPNAV